MQELARNAFDYYRDEDETSRPVLISIKKGTVLPPSLIAFHQDPSFFSLQPFHSMKLHEFNNILDEFYATHATVFDAEEWFGKNNFYEAAADADPEQWPT
ncbi:uncharacterized protein Z518_03814 [Rhinocladiella mackenziei CBS 650.93]|uniref:Tse2 ADP-ribosyltransferase toxin domain-containing protein n=1 Tax=Rhinocladiella mackenziei CBS 650.93 TaxID=1442369 RepID=A0A0D2IRS6_9EURO|nr:uncharacterized protein Z518_03814 [Rhinocladiella mackenziei CBS 650.93]KIX05841.1 hypothetical protein Z518_03814 [Rhinocladiella mackenziei CBS 650.93]